MFIVAGAAALALLFFAGCLWAVLFLAARRLEPLAARAELLQWAKPIRVALWWMLTAIPLLPASYCAAMLFRPHPWPPNDWSDVRFDEYLRAELLWATVGGLVVTTGACAGMLALQRRTRARELVRA